DLRLGTPLGWDALEVARMSAREAIGESYVVDLVLLRRRARGACAPSDLVGQPATLAIATEARFRPIHGLLSSVEEIDRKPEFQLLRARLEPRWALAKRRVQYRSFVDRSLSEILRAVLEHRGPDGASRPGGLLPADP